MAHWYFISSTKLFCLLDIFRFYVAEGTVEGHKGLPVSEMCSHYYSAYPPFEVAEEDADEGALRCAAGQSSGRDLVEEFVAYGVWPLAHGWALGDRKTLLCSGIGFHFRHVGNS